jgi:hypothetical protein
MRRDALFVHPHHCLLLVLVLVPRAPTPEYDCPLGHPHHDPVADPLGNAGRGHAPLLDPARDPDHGLLACGSGASTHAPVQVLALALLLVLDLALLLVLDLALLLALDLALQGEGINDDSALALALALQGEGVNDDSALALVLVPQSEDELTDPVHVPILVLLREAEGVHLDPTNILALALAHHRGDIVVDPHVRQPHDIGGVDELISTE